MNTELSNPPAAGPRAVPGDAVDEWARSCAWIAKDTSFIVCWWGVVSQLFGGSPALFSNASVSKSCQMG